MDKKFLEQAVALGKEKSNCKKIQVGCLITNIKKEGMVFRDQVIGLGWNYILYPERYCPSCDLSGHCFLAEHAEIMAIKNAISPLKEGFGLATEFLPAELKTEGGTLYCSLAPCIQCAVHIVRVRIKTVVFARNYKEPDGIRYLINNGINVIHLEVK